MWFPGNPWPEGHRIAEFDWTGRLDEAGRLWFDLTLRTADYDEADSRDDDDEDVPAWDAPSVWTNYHACRISSTFWGDATGVLAIGWTGRVALTYVGDEEFRYEFRAEISGAELTRVTAPVGMPAAEARRQVAHLLTIPEDRAAALLPAFPLPVSSRSVES